MWRDRNVNIVSVFVWVARLESGGSGVGEVLSGIARLPDLPEVTAVIDEDWGRSCDPELPWETIEPGMGDFGGPLECGVKIRRPGKGVVADELVVPVPPPSP